MLRRFGYSKILIVMTIVLLMGAGLLIRGGQDRPISVVLLVNGTLGDLSFFDSAARGLAAAAEELGINYTIVEMAHDRAVWGPTLMDIAYEDYDLIIVGTWDMRGHLHEVARLHPERRFLIFDAAVDYKRYGLTNVHSILYKQNEGAFLAGALAALVTTSTMERANPEPLIGFLGGMDIPVINDFLVGYIAGARYIYPNIRIFISYAGTFADPARGKELALAQLRAGVDIVFHAASLTGLGLLEAIRIKDNYAIGVDSDQALIFQELKDDPVTARRILSSMLKRVDMSLLYALRRFVAGTLPFGEAHTLGLAEGAVGLADNWIFRKYLPVEFQDLLTDLKRRIITGEIVVPTAFGMAREDLDALRDGVRP
ncbi:BMP family ABC transporter substrate-binding protein [Candidatus Acetothermia bacterium]|nr:BMP family ABC transporter substrate-binding protein [Candidatus Acetothermia bacterium]